MNNKYKYPRTPHLPFSLGATEDDRILKYTDQRLSFIPFIENTSITPVSDTR